MKVKIRCHSCEGVGYVKETEFYFNEEVKVLCPECDGRGFVVAQKWPVRVEGFTKKVSKSEEA